MSLCPGRHLRAIPSKKNLIKEINTWLLPLKQTRDLFLSHFTDSKLYICRRSEPGQCKRLKIQYRETGGTQAGSVGSLFGGAALPK